MKIKYIFTCILFSLISFFNLSIIYALEEKDNNKLGASSNQYIHKDKYILGPGDLLQISFPYAPSLSGEYLILSNGSLPLPLVGNMDIRNKSINEAESILTEEFAKQLLRPDLRLKVLRFRPVKVSIIGEVNVPGLYQFENVPNNLPTLVKALQKAGGVTSQTDLRDIEVIRRFNVKEKSLKKTSLSLVDIITKGDQTQNIYLQDGDVVTLKRALDIPDEYNSMSSSNVFPPFIRVNILGKVSKPGMVSIRSNTTLVQAIMKAGGPTKWKSNKGNVELIRINQNGSAYRKRFKFDLTQSMSAENNPILKDGDLVKVNPTLIENISGGLGAITDPLSGILNSIAIIKLIDD